MVESDYASVFYRHQEGGLIWRETQRVNRWRSARFQIDYSSETVASGLGGNEGKDELPLGVGLESCATEFRNDLVTRPRTLQGSSA
jgi:hypothetical protein